MFCAFNATVAAPAPAVMSFGYLVCEFVTVAWLARGGQLVLYDASLLNLLQLY